MQAIEAAGDTSWERCQWWSTYEQKMRPVSAERMEHNHRELVDDPAIQELMPLTVMSLNRDLPDDVEYAALHAEDIAYGNHLIENNIEAVGMFHSRAIAAANEDNAEWDRICLAIEKFNIEAIEDVYGH